MTITKFGHCCLLIEIDGKRILTDPGSFSTDFASLTEIDLILITHEHGDHCHTEAITSLLLQNPDAIVVTNTSVSNLLAQQGIETHIVEGRDVATILDIEIEAHDGPHVEIFEDFGLVQNTGYLIAKRFFYPGDAYTVPDSQVEILGLPVAGPWCKLTDALHYALQVHPHTAIPVHDAVLSDAGIEVVYTMCNRVLSKEGIVFTPLTKGTPHRF